MKTLTRIDQPETEPVTLGQAKAFLLETNSDQDAYITALISMAREAVEDYTRRAFIEQTWKLTLDQWPVSEGSNPRRLRNVELDRTPLVSVESVKYWPADGGDQVELAQDTDYLLILGTVPGQISVLSSSSGWPDTAVRPDAIEIEFTAGNVDTAPSRAKQAIYLTMANWYENRVPVVVGTIASEVPNSVKGLLQSLKVSGFVT